VLFDQEKTSPDILREVLLSKPSKELKKGFVWHIGNVTEINDAGIYFAIGRTTKSIVERYDEVDKNFVEEDFETSPYTHAILDLKYQVLAVASKSRLSPKAKAIAKQFEKLANDTLIVKSLKRKVEVAELNDPETFISHIQRAYSVVHFSMNFGEPNPWDVNKDFQKPMQSLLHEASGTRGRTSISGPDLDRELIEELTRATASTGNTAKAIVKSSKELKGVTKYLKANPVALNEEGLEKDGLQKFISRVREAYLNIRKINQKTQ
jgi:hypothetical protein